MRPDIVSKVGVDADIIAYSCSFATQGKSLEELKDAIHGVVDYIIAQTVVFPNENNVSGYLTGPNNFRFDIATTYEYKGNRKHTQKPEWLDTARSYLTDTYGFPVVVGYEADDALAMEATAHSDYVIASVDKDFGTVPGWKFNPRKGTFSYDTPYEALKFFYTQLLTGDKSDNIIGLYKVGPVGAEKILEGAKDEVDMFERVLKAYRESESLVGDPLDRILENGRLLHLQRYKGQLWEFPDGLKST